MLLVVYSCLHGNLSIPSSTLCPHTYTRTHTYTHPHTHAHVRKGLGLEEVPDFDLDSEDEEWLNAQTNERVRTSGWVIGNYRAQ